MEAADLQHQAGVYPFPAPQEPPENLVAAKVQPADGIEHEEIADGQSIIGKFRTFLADVILRWRVSRTKANQNEKCPACGHRTGRIEFESKSARLWHHCLICRARWSESPILNPTEWHR